MAIAPPDIAASALQPRPSGPTGPERKAARGRLRLRRWLDELADIGRGVVQLIRARVVERREYPAASWITDLDLVGNLVARAMRWSRALRIRLAAEAEAAKAAMKLANRWREPAERLNDWYDGEDEVDWLDRSLRRMRNPPPAEAGAPDDCIDGLPTAEVVGQICTDLGIAAALFRSAAMGQQIAAIAAGAHALLDGAGEPWTPPPILPAMDRAAAVQKVTLQAAARRMLAPVAAPEPVPDPVPAPDTG